MSILSATNLSQSVGSADIFDSLSLTIAHDDKIGLIGPNGIGKTTLLRVLAGGEKPHAGQVVLAGKTRVGYVQQEAMLAFEGRTHTLYEEMLGAFDHVRGLEKQMREREHYLAEHHDDERVLAEYGELLEQFEANGGYDYEDRIAPMLQGLGLAQLAQTPLHHLSGGQKTRAMLARQLLAQPDLLILDEPTNHLDIESIEWLEGFLQAWRGALLMVSHDRQFLDRVVNKIYELRRGVADRVELETYRGNYSDYVTERTRRLAYEQFVFDQEKSRLDNELRLVKIDLDKVKGGNDVDVSWAKGKLRRLTRDVITIEQLGVMALKSENWLTLSQQIEGQTRPWGYDECERRVRSLRRPAPPPRIEFGVAAVNRGSNDVIVAENLVVGYDKTLFVCDALLLQRGARVAVIGANGSGKTTFIKTLFGAVPTRGGKLHLGASVHVGYFAQAHDRLNLQARLLDELLTHAPHLRDEQGRHYLAKFLFKGDDVYKFVYGLSGGERARLALAILALQKPNLLVLDEPTNHLDIYALEALEQVLANYNGSMLFVTHDRQLVDKLATEIWYIEHGRMHIFRGRYDGWRRFKNQSLIIKPSESKAKGQALDLERAAQSRGDTHSKNELRRREQAIATIEREVSLCDAALTELSAQIAANPPYEQLMALTAEYESAQLKLNEAILRWERVMNEFAT